MHRIIKIRKNGLSSILPLCLHVYLCVLTLPLIGDLLQSHISKGHRGVSIDLVDFEIARTLQVRRKSFINKSNLRISTDVLYTIVTNILLVLLLILLTLSYSPGINNAKNTRLT